jgi:hypothetical protein
MGGDADQQPFHEWHTVGQGQSDATWSGWSSTGHGGVMPISGRCSMDSALATIITDPTV